MEFTCTWNKVHNEEWVVFHMDTNIIHITGPTFASPSHFVMLHCDFQHHAQRLKVITLKSYAFFLISLN